MTDGSGEAGSPIAAPHRRRNVLTGEWVLVSPHRTERPWQGGTEPVEDETRAEYEPDCYLCPGNARAGGARNPAYESTFVFENDYAALSPTTVAERVHDGLLESESEPGSCRVICYSPRHDRDMAAMSVEEISAVIDVWKSETAALSERYRWVQVFENRGATMGASNPHPHGQVWAGTALPNQAAAEDAQQRRHFEETGRLLLTDYALQEVSGSRVVWHNPEWLIVVPFWATWPYETLVIPTGAVRSLPQMSDDQHAELARALQALLAAYDQLFSHPFPYSMGIHGAPAPAADHPHWQLHLHFYPPLLRSASIRKHMVGYELLAEVQRDLTPETAAAQLAALTAAHTAG